MQCNYAKHRTTVGKICLIGLHLVGTHVDQMTTNVLSGKFMTVLADK